MTKLIVVASLLAAVAVTPALVLRTCAPTHTTQRAPAATCSHVLAPGESC